MQIRIENIPPDTTQNLLQKVFEEYGSVASVEIIHERLRTVGFVMMPDSGAWAARGALPPARLVGC
jgi:RNA recognition motif-containing protein